MNKVITIDEAINKLHDGMSVALGGFAGVGSPLKCIEKIAQKGVKDLTLICLTNSHPFNPNIADVGPLFFNKQVKKFITSHTGTNPVAMEQCRKGELTIEFFPMGSWVEKLRAAGAGLGGVLTPTGVGTLIENGKQKIMVDGKEYILEVALRADIAFIKGYRADRMGNVQYRGVSLNTNPVVAMAANYTVAEVNEIVEIGEIDPERVGTSGIFVQAVVQGYTMPEHQEIFQNLWMKGGILKA